MVLSNDQNLEFINNPSRVAAEKRLHEAVRQIVISLKNDGNAGYYLTVLPPKIRELEVANDNLIMIEAALEAELAGKQRWHG